MDEILLFDDLLTVDSDDKAEWADTNLKFPPRLTQTWKCGWTRPPLVFLPASVVGGVDVGAAVQ